MDGAARVPAMVPQHYSPATSAALLEHVTSFIKDIDRLIAKAETIGVSDATSVYIRNEHPRLPLIHTSTQSLCSGNLSECVGSVLRRCYPSTIILEGILNHVISRLFAGMQRVEDVRAIEPRERSVDPYERWLGVRGFIGTETLRWIGEAEDDDARRWYCISEYYSRCLFLSSVVTGIHFHYQLNLKGSGRSSLLLRN